MAKDAKPAELTNVPPKKSKKLLIIIAAVVLLLAALAGAAVLLLKSSPSDDEEADEEVAEESVKKSAKKKDKGEPPVFVNLDTFSSRFEYLLSKEMRLQTRYVLVYPVTVGLSDVVGYQFFFLNSVVNRKLCKIYSHTLIF